MPSAIPENVREMLGQLPASQQVVLRGYIATLREEIKEKEQEILQLKDGDPHAHYHGHEKCTADHNHDTDHKEPSEHSHGHDHHPKEETHTDHSHDHGHKEKHDHDSAHEHKHEHKHDHGNKHDHGHKDHHAEKEQDHKHGHKHAEEKEHDTSEHDHHRHDHGAKEDIPEWKKKAMDADPTAAPFGGNWNTESEVSATKDSDKMEE